MIVSAHKSPTSPPRRGRVRVLLVAPPRRVWPYVDEQDNYLLPQWLVCLAAVLRRDGADVRALDCMPERLGWKSLGARIRALAPDVVACGENHALFASEVVRLVELVKSIDSGIATVVGGAHFTNTAQLYLPRHPMDFIVRGEGEVTLVELVRALGQGDMDGARQVPGVAYLDGGEVVYTPPRPLVEDLDQLPLPAYDLLPLQRYGRSRYLFSPGGTTIHHSRGCVGSCRFCSWWRQMARREPASESDGEPGVASCDGACVQERLIPQWRTKSVGRTLEEMEVLHRRYGKRCLVFVDPTFNVDPGWNEEFADRLIKKRWDLVWFAFMRADFVLRDEQLGIMDRLVRSGMAHVCIGVERKDPRQLEAWNKPFAARDAAGQAFALLRRRYPQVFRQATFIVGTRAETPRSLEAQLSYARSIDADYPAFHPVTPFPGTDLYEEARHKGWLEITDFDSYDMMTAIMGSEQMTRDEIEAAMVDLNRRLIGPLWLLRGLLSKSSYRRKMYIWWLLVTGRIFLESAAALVNPLRPERYTSTMTPPWYEG